MMCDASACGLAVLGLLLREAEVESGFWNCPCVPMRERKECHCMLFLTEDNDFVGDEQTITIEECKELAEGM